MQSRRALLGPIRCRRCTIAVTPADGLQLAVVTGDKDRSTVARLAETALYGLLDAAGVHPVPPISVTVS